MLINNQAAVQIDSLMWTSFDMDTCLNTGLVLTVLQHSKSYSFL